MRFANRFFQQLLSAIKRDWLPLLLCSAFVIVAQLTLQVKGVNGLDPMSILLNTRLFLICILFYLSLAFLWAIFRKRPESPINFAKIFVREKLHWSIVVRHIPIITALCVFMPVFSAMKGSISLFVVYNWDQTFIDWDRFIHGMDAWKLIHPVFGFPFATFVLNNFYNLWIVVIYGTTVFMTVRLKDPILRQRFLICYFICWIFLGTILAILFASVGPVFVGPIFGQRTFEPLTDYLAEANMHYRILSVEVQAKLLAQYSSRETALGAGITAMPSMHNCMTFLFFMVMRHISPVAAWLYGIFCVLIFIGSVHLGYHYAIDAYVSIILTAFIWRLSGWRLSRNFQPDQR